MNLRARLPNLLWRTLGFLVPTLVIVTWLHLAREGAGAEALDGLASGVWFGVAFLAGSAMVRPIRRHAGPVPPHRQVLVGAATALIAWPVVWLFWALPVTDAWRRAGSLPFVVNSLAMVVAGIWATRTRS